MATRSDGAPGGAETLYASFGVMGGFMQPQGHLQVLSALVDDTPAGLAPDPQAALDRPRFCLMVPGEHGAGRVALEGPPPEGGIPAETLLKLQAMGHPVDVVTGYGRALFGRGQIILRDPQSGVLTGGSDPRADGCAMSL